MRPVYTTQTIDVPEGGTINSLAFKCFIYIDVV
jgi:hypothetical protein